MVRWALLLSILGSVASVTTNSHAKSEGKVSLNRFVAKAKGLVPDWVSKQNSPIFTCKEFTDDKAPGMFTSKEQTELFKAWKPICDNKKFSYLAETWIEPGFEKNYHNIYAADGWIDEAYVSYMSFKASGTLTEDQILGLVKSVHANSQKPIVVVNYGAVPSVKLNPKTFPRLVVLHSHDLSMLPNQIAFNFNKFRAMMSSKVRTTVQLDADQLVFGKADRMFARTREEVTADYPYPILPVHWMSRDNDPKFKEHPYDVYDFQCPKCPKRTMRWGHAHPTMTFYALPFLSSSLIDVMNHRKLSDGQNLGQMEDEDILNVMSWEKGLTKQWCKFDIPWVHDVNLFMEGKGGENSQDWDPKWFPEGIPKVFYTAHHAYDYKENMEALMMFAKDRTEIMKKKPILFRKKDAPPSSAQWFETGKELAAAHPELKCII